MFNKDNEWTFVYDNFDPERELHREALLTQGNGYFGTRGALEEVSAGEQYYPGTYMASLYNRLISKVADKDITNEDFVNCPDWTLINLSINNGPFFKPEENEILDLKRELNFKTGILSKQLRFKDQEGRITAVTSSRFISMDNFHLAGISYKVTAENYSGSITIRSGLKGDIINYGVARYRELASRHLEPVKEEAGGKELRLTVKTSQSGIYISEHASHKVYKDGSLQDISGTAAADKAAPVVNYTLTLEKGSSATVEKMVAVVNSLHTEEDTAELAAGQLAAAGDYQQEAEKSSRAWDKIWQDMDINISANAELTKILRFHAYHLMITASPHNTQLDAAVPARGLHGEAYRGHIFWDEMYILPFFIWHYPRVARSLLMYRIRRLDEARAYAREHGYKGAMYPWQSGSDGREETQVIHLNPKSGEWGPDYSSLQRHVSLAIFFNIWNYYKNSGDTDFLAENGAEVMLEIARFWVSMCTYNKKTQKYEIHRVMGPNEFHEKMPGHEEGGLKDNTYTNFLTSWALDRCLELQTILPEEKYKQISSAIGLAQSETDKWKEISANINIPRNGKLLDQYDGFMKLKELDWEAYRKKYNNDIGRMDRILKAEGASPDEFQVSKQADLLMIFYVLPFGEIMRQFSKLGIDFTMEDLKANYDYYLKRTSHGSTLSLIVHAYLAKVIGSSEDARQWYNKALTADIDDIQGGTTKEGIHTGLMAGTLVMLTKGFAGVETDSGVLELSPDYPAEWGTISLPVFLKGDRYDLKL
ncbi:MAG TPA: beta-phosphoglucomutase, partial [Spirochaetota bacterium]|nr:beta-phosphoglucomutase [Spirochaetota bacterium]